MLCSCPALPVAAQAAIGLEVENLSNPAEALAPFRVAKVLTAEKHPQADKLQVLTVDGKEFAQSLRVEADPEVPSRIIAENES